MLAPHALQQALQQPMMRDDDSQQQQQQQVETKSRKSGCAISLLHYRNVAVAVPQSHSHAVLFGQILAFISLPEQDSVGCDAYGKNHDAYMPTALIFLDNLSVAARHILVIGSHNNKMTCCSVVARQDDYFWGVMVVFVHVFADEITRKENPRIRLPRLHKAPFSSEGRVRCFSLFQIISSSRSRD
jgi:hypothetical protein